jgi:hypothetical protein
MGSLEERLGAFRRRRRAACAARGLGRLLPLVLGTAALAGCLDWGLRLPPLVRAVALTGGLWIAGRAAFRYLIFPLRSPADDLSLAFSLEKAYPNLGDSLASAVEFRRQPDSSDRFGSPVLRRETVRRALGEMDRLDFRRAADARGLAAGFGLASLTGTAALLVAFLYPGPVQTALGRLADPFGDLPWPPRTRLEVEAPAQLARGSPLEIRATVTGVVPPHAAAEFDDGVALRQSHPVLREEGTDRGQLVVRREHVERDLRFRIQANDAVSGWYVVSVAPPPTLVARDGRPSPQVRLEHPAYTGLAPRDLPDGSGAVEAVAGTHVTWRAAADRPLARAWIEFRPEPAACTRAAVVALWGARDALGLLGRVAAGRQLWDPVPVRIDSSGRLLEADFLPRLSGSYAVHLQDESGLRHTSVFDLRVSRDPEPVVSLESSTFVRERIELVPDGEVSLRVSAEDVIFGLRSVYLEYQTQGVAPPRRITLFAEAEAAGPSPRATPPQRLEFRHRLRLAEIRHPNGGELRQGDMLTLRACAEDFDDVSVEKSPGHSRSVEVRVVDRRTLELHLRESQTRIRREVARLEKAQEESMRLAGDPQGTGENGNDFPATDVGQLFHAEQLQRQIHAAVGSSPADGLRREVAHLLELLAVNHLPPSDFRQRLEAVATELARVADQLLDRVEPQLTRARKGHGSPDGKAELDKARQLQRDARAAFAAVLQLLEPSAREDEVARESRAAPEEQGTSHLRRKLADAEHRTEGLARQQDELRKKAAAAGQSGDEEPRQDSLRRLGPSQERLRHELRELVRELSRLGSEAARQAAERADDRMEDAGSRLGRGEDASEAIEEARDHLEEARQGLQRQRSEVEEELAREQLGRAADQVKRVKERQEAAAAESERLGRVAAADRGWQPPLRASLRELAESQRGLARESEALTVGWSRTAPVLARLLSRAAAAMNRAGDRLAGLVEQEPKHGHASPLWQEASEFQREAVRRLGQVLAALESGGSSARNAPAPPPARAEAGAAIRGDAAFSLPAQLRGLRAWQLDLNERTIAFDERHPTAPPSDRRAAQEAGVLHHEQREIFRLFTEVTKPADPKGSNPVPDLESAGLLERVAQNMRGAERNLARGDAGEDTRRMQREVVEDLDRFRESNGRASAVAGSRPLPRPTVRGVPRRGVGTPPPSAGESQDPASGTGGGDDRAAAPKPDKIADLPSGVWGHLPEKVRQEMDQYARERFMPRYSDLLREYYRTLSEKGTRPVD